MAGEDIGTRNQKLEGEHYRTNDSLKDESSICGFSGVRSTAKCEGIEFMEFDGPARMRPVTVLYEPEQRLMA